MTETAVKTSVCDACGADVRDESLFCYNCGERVVDNERASASDQTVQEDIPETPALLKADGAAESTPQKLPGSRPPLKSAASLRQERRAFNRQPVEVSWVPPESTPIGFVITTIVFVVGALVLLGLALYLR